MILLLQSFNIDYQPIIIISRGAEVAGDLLHALHIIAGFVEFIPSCIGHLSSVLPSASISWVKLLVGDGKIHGSPGSASSSI
jgi:hypothetical protein